MTMPLAALPMMTWAVCRCLPATAWLFSNLLPPAQVPQQTLTEAGELINPLPPIAAELHETYR